MRHMNGYFQSLSHSMENRDFHMTFLKLDEASEYVAKPQTRYYYLRKTLNFHLCFTFRLEIRTSLETFALGRVSEVCRVSSSPSQYMNFSNTWCNHQKIGENRTRSLRLCSHKSSCKWIWSKIGPERLFVGKFHATTFRHRIDPMFVTAKEHVQFLALFLCKTRPAPY